MNRFLYTSSTAVNHSFCMGGGEFPEVRIKIAATATEQRPASIPSTGIGGANTEANPPFWGMAGIDLAAAIAILPAISLIG